MDLEEFDDEMRALAREDDDGEKEVYKSSLNIYDLPSVLMLEILEALDGPTLIAVAGSHQKLLYATKHLQKKTFDDVHCVAAIQPDSPIFAQTPEVLEMLLRDAYVQQLCFHLDARVIRLDGLKVATLSFRGQDRDDKAADVIEKLKPKWVLYTPDGTSTITPRLCEVLSTVEGMFLGHIGMEFIDLLPEFQFRILGFCLLTPESYEPLPARYWDVFRQLLDQYNNGLRPKFLLFILYARPVTETQFRENMIGPDYPLRPTGPGIYGNNDGPVPPPIQITFATWSLQISIS